MSVGTRLGNRVRAVRAVTGENRFVAVLDEFQKVDNDGAGGFLDEHETDQILQVDRLFRYNFTDYASSIAELLPGVFWNADRQRRRLDFLHGISGHIFYLVLVLVGFLLLDSKLSSDDSWPVGALPSPLPVKGLERGKTLS